MSTHGLSERLRIARAASGLKQNHVSAELKISPTALANYEHGRTDPKSFTLIKLALMYRVSLNWLLTGINKLEHRFEFDLPTPAPEPPTLPEPERCIHLVPISERCMECEK